jgi:hypothetical protein
MDDPSQIPPVDLSDAPVNVPMNAPINEPGDLPGQERAGENIAEPVTAATPDDGRRELLRRMRWLMVAAIASFALAGWMIVRYTSLAGRNASASDQVAIVRAEIEALSRGDLKSAYGLLSERYRKEVPYENYHALVSEYRRAFLTRAYRVTRRDEIRGRTVIEAQLVTVNGQHYLAKFTLVQTAGKWWIDDLHWAAQSEQLRA